MEAFESYKLSSPCAAKTATTEEVIARAYQLEKEMDLLVAPLYSKISKDNDGKYSGDYNIFMKGAPGHIDSRRPRDREFFEYWQKIKQNMHLAQGDLYSGFCQVIGR